MARTLGALMFLVWLTGAMVAEAKPMPAKQLLQMATEKARSIDPSATLVHASYSGGTKDLRFKGANFIFFSPQKVLSKKRPYSFELMFSDGKFDGMQKCGYSRIPLKGIALTPETAIGTVMYHEMGPWWSAHPQARLMAELAPAEYMRRAPGFGDRSREGVFIWEIQLYGLPEWIACYVEAKQNEFLGCRKRTVPGSHRKKGLQNHHASCLKDLPLYPRLHPRKILEKDEEKLARVYHHTEIHAYTTEDSPRKVVAYYRRNGPDGGWRKSGAVTSDTNGLFSWEKRGVVLQLLVGPGKNGGAELLAFCGPKLEKGAQGKHSAHSKGAQRGRVHALYTKRNGLVDNQVLSLATAPDGTVWVGSSEGLSRFHGGSWNRYTGTGVPTLAVVSDGTLWVGTPFGGVLKLNREGWHVYTTRNGLLNNKVSSLAIGPDGSVWVGSCDVRGGVSRYDGTRWIRYGEHGELPDRCVQALAVTPGGRLWVGTKKGLATFDGNRWSQFLPDRKINALLVTPDGTLWAGTDHGALSYDPGRGWRKYRRDTEGGEMKRIRALFASPNNGALWLGGEGLWRLENDRLKRYLSARDIPGGIVTAITIGPDGKLWIGTFKGIVIFPFTGENGRIDQKIPPVPAQRAF